MPSPLVAFRRLFGLLLLAGSISATRAVPVTIEVFRFTGDVVQSLPIRPSAEQIRNAGKPAWTWTTVLASGTPASLEYASAGRRIFVTFNPEQIGDRWSLQFQFREEAAQPEAGSNAPPNVRSANSLLTLREGESLVAGVLASKSETSDGESRSEAYFAVISLGKP